ncbi:actin binding Rho activating protein b [Vanacampus margaritifer]
MSNQQTDHRKLSANKNIKKLRAISKVCGLAKSWQQWISENEKKQAAEPCGWSPWQSNSTEEAIPSQKTEDSPCYEVASKNVSDPPHLPERTAIEDANNSKVPRISSSIKMKLVMKTATSGPQDRSAGVKRLTKSSEKGGSGEDADGLFETKGSPTRQRKCSDVVLSLTQNWMQVENDEMPGKEDSPEEQILGEQILGADSMEDSGLSPLESDALNTDNEASLSSLAKVCDGESLAKIKRPQILTSGKEAVEANKINALSKKYSPVRNLKSRWQNWASVHTDNQKLNPFSEYFDSEYSMSLRLRKGQDGYGRPKEGTKTAERAKRAEKHIHGEISDMCYVIRTMADPDQDGKTRVTFGELFDRYVRISDKVVGILMRARKHGKVHFEGEMLWQGQDDGVIITLLV